MSALQDFSAELVELASVGGASVVAVAARQRFSSSGIHWQPGVVVTAHHTVRRDEDLRVTLPDGAAVAAHLVGRDAGTDLAVLRLDEIPAGLPVASPAPPDGLRVGQIVLAVARSPEDGLGTSLGVLSAVSGPWKTWRGAAVDAFIQPDLRLYPGFSGGALVTLEGRVIGMNTSGLSRIMAITVPAATVAARVERILAHGGMARGYLGVAMQPVRLPAGLDSEVGILLLSVAPDSPAARAGLLLGDVLLALDGTPTHDVEDVLALLEADAVGRAMHARVLRAGREMDVEVTVGERPPAE